MSSEGYIAEENVVCFLTLILLIGLTYLPVLGTNNEHDLAQYHLCYFTLKKVSDLIISPADDIPSSITL